MSDKEALMNVTILQDHNKNLSGYESVEFRAWCRKRGLIKELNNSIEKGDLILLVIHNKFAFPINSAHKFINFHVRE